MKKTVIGKVRGESFLYIVLNLDYKFGSQLLQSFSLDLFDPPIYGGFPLLYSLV